MTTSTATNQDIRRELITLADNIITYCAEHGPGRRKKVERQFWGMAETVAEIAEALKADDFDQAQAWALELLRAVISAGGIVQAEGGCGPCYVTTDAGASDNLNFALSFLSGCETLTGRKADAWHNRTKR